MINEGGRRPRGAPAGKELSSNYVILNYVIIVHISNYQVNVLNYVIIVKL